jgi:hypothetical protein
MDIGVATNGAVEEHDLQKHTDELVNNWIDRTLTPAIQKQVCLGLSGRDGLRPCILLCKSLLGQSCKIALVLGVRNEYWAS